MIYTEKTEFTNKKEIYDFSLVGAQLYTYSRELMQSKLIDQCYKYGYEPIIIETDSLTARKEFIDAYKQSAPTVRNIHNEEVPLFFDDIGLKQFGQLETEIKEIVQIHTFLKKSYYIQKRNKDEKFRFKGVSSRAILPDQSTRELLRQYADMKSYYERLYKTKAVTKEIEEKMITASSLIGLKIDQLGQGNKHLLNGPGNAVKVFKKLANKEEVSIIQTAIKKNYIQGANDQLVLENVIVDKTFNQSKLETERSTTHRRSTKFINNYNKIIDKLGNISVDIEQIDD